MTCSETALAKRQVGAMHAASSGAAPHGPDISVPGYFRDGILPSFYPQHDVDARI
jgi:hypothetical protein